MKRVFFAFILLLLVSAAGARLAYRVPEEKKATVLVRAERLDSAVLDAIDVKTVEASLDGSFVLATPSKRTPSRLFLISEGMPVYFDSRLSEDLIMTLDAVVTERNGVLYLGETLLSPMKRCVLSSSEFYLEVQIISVKVG